MAENSKKQGADAQFKKQQRAEDGKKAMSEYELGAAAVAAKTARLRALRLARDAAEQAAAPPSAGPVKKAAKKKKAVSASASLSDWLKTKQDGGHNN